MAIKVIKKDGSKEAFGIEKIKRNIVAASQAAGIEEAKQKEIAETVSDKVMKTLQEQMEVTSMEVRDQILKELDLSAPIVADHWRKYESDKKK